MFPKDFKKVVVHPPHKKDCKTEKSNYWPISILPNLSKIHERLLCDQMYTYFSDFSLNINAAFVRDIVPNTASQQWLKKWKKPEITTKYALRSLLVSQKHFIVFCMIFVLQNYMPLVLILRPWELFMHI